MTLTRLSHPRRAQHFGAGHRLPWGPACPAGCSTAPPGSVGPHSNPHPACGDNNVSRRGSGYPGPSEKS